MKQSKLTLKEVNSIVDCVNKGIPKADIARRFGMPAPSLYGMIKRYVKLGVFSEDGEHLKVMREDYFKNPSYVDHDTSSVQTTENQDLGDTPISAKNTLGIGQSGKRYGQNLSKSKAVHIDVTSSQEGRRFLKDPSALDRIDSLLRLVEESDSHVIKDMFRDLAVEIFKSNLK